MNEKQRKEARKKIVYDKNGWADAIKYKPIPFDLVQVEDEKGRRQFAWFTGFEWEFGIKKISGKIMVWRKQKDSGDDRVMLF